MQIKLLKLQLKIRWFKDNEKFDRCNLNFLIISWKKKKVVFVDNRENGNSLLLITNFCHDSFPSIQQINPIPIIYSYVQVLFTM